MNWYILLLLVVFSSADQYDDHDVLDMTVRACENYDVKLACPSGMYIYVYYADYGRSDTKYCLDRTRTVLYEPNKNPDVTTTNTDCHSYEKPLNFLQNQCNFKNNCSAITCNGLYGNSCPGTNKYVTVSYRCINSDLSFNVMSYGGQIMSYTCQYFDGILSCPEGRTLRIDDVDYGRHNQDICLDYPSLTGKVFQVQQKSSCYTTNINCHSWNAKEVIKELCDYRQSCTVTASNDLCGDPCSDTYKYLSIKYRCV